MNRKTLALAATLAFALPTSAFAAGHEAVAIDQIAGTEMRSIAVSVSDLDLTSGHGARLADSRITRAAQKACGFMKGSVQQPTREYRACLNDALSGARADLVSRGQS